jgi:L,D-peptidoglycan transpeptidase YkuD (ErfK/YbiS/YcfS/YnhG family)
LFHDYPVIRILPVFLAAVLSAGAFELPEASSQCIVGQTKGWNSSDVSLTTYEKKGGKWVKVAGPWAGKVGKNGLVWGLGISPRPPGATIKNEGDNRAPAGVFLIGDAWGYDASIRKSSDLAYHQVTAHDLWVEDTKSQSYNQHVLLDHDPVTEWEKKQQMKQNDHAHSLKLFIDHNAPPAAKPGAGSAIFFHIWRGEGSKPTAGCTTMPEDQLRGMIKWIEPKKQPVYVLLPDTEYAAKKDAWKLP